MTTNHIDICGITPRCNLPKCSCKYPCKELCETHKFCIPICKPDIENILQLFIDTSIKKSNILDTPMGKKFVIYGNIHTKILYVANTSCQSVHSAHFDIPFCTFIMIGNITREITDVCLFIEDAFITQLDSENFSVSMLVLVYPLLKKKDHCINCNDGCNENCYIDNSKNKNFNYMNNCISGDEDYIIKSDSLPNIDFNKDSNKSFDIKYDKKNNIHDIEYAMNQSNTSDIKIDIDNSKTFDIEYDMNQSNISDIESEINYDMDFEDCIDSNFIYEDEYFETEWK